MSEGRCSTKVDLPLKKRAMKKQFSPPAVKPRTENGSAEAAEDHSETRTRRQAGELCNQRVLRGEDSEAFDNIMQKQLEIVEGTEQFYKRIDQSLKDGKVEPFFVKEQWDLYAWREKFFNDNFPCGRSRLGQHTRLTCCFRLLAK
jgi:demethoxyubiquinone hydroxylase (CLK1/Coq7/Cat5 family)